LSRFPPERDGVGDYVYEWVPYLSKHCDVSILTFDIIDYNKVDFVNGVRVLRLLREGGFAGVQVASAINGLDFDVLHFQTTTFMYNRRFLTFPLFLNNVPLVTTVHDAPRLRQFHYLPLHHYLYRRSSKLIALSKNVAEALLYFHRVNPSKLTLMHHGADVDRFHPTVSPKPFREKYDLDNSFIIMQFGFVGKGKGADLLLRAFATVADKMPDAKLVVAGVSRTAADNLFYEHVRLLAGSKRLKGRVVFTGYVPSELVPSCLASADIFALPYLGASQSGPLHRALASGRALIASDLPSFRELISHGYNGLLVKPGNVEELANSITLLYRDDEMRKRLFRNARRTAEKLLDWRKIALATFKLYKDLLG